MKTTRRSFPWAIIATAAVAGASFVGIASYVNGNRNQPLGTDEVPISVQDVTPTASNDPNHKQGSEGTHSSNDHHQSVERVTASELNGAVKAAGFENARVIGLEIDGSTAIVDMNPGIVDTLGSTGEAELVETLKKSLSKDKRVKNFQIRINGEIQRTLGHGDLSSPVSVR